MVITKRLRLRKFKEDDLEELYDYRNNDRCNKYQRYNDTSKEYLNNFIKVNKSSEFLLEEEQHFAIALRTGELIGDLSIYFNNNTITIGYTISYKYQRNGYAFVHRRTSIDFSFSDDIQKFRCRSYFTYRRTSRNFLYRNTW